jgi:tryptophan synthase alpha chain
MGYYNPIYRYGAERFCKDAHDAGIDGVIIVDLPPEEDEELRPLLTKHGLNFIRLIAPTSNAGRLPVLCKSASGFVYYISVTGITGVKSADNTQLSSQVEHLRGFTKLPVAVGFGIKTAQQVKDVAAFSDAVVVGSALVDTIAKQTGKDAAVKAATQFVSELAKGLNR